MLALWLTLATASYTLARILADRDSMSIFIALGLLALIILFVAALYFAEGCEIAAMTVLERDEDELDLGNTARVLDRLRDNTQEFVSGRQLLVLGLVIGFAAFCEAFARGAPRGQLLGYDNRTSWLFQDSVIRLYSVVFPIVTALWLSQLLSKFIASRRPATFFRAPIAQLVVQLSILLGTSVHVGDLSIALSERLLRKRPDDTRTASRIKLYSALAAFKDGFGFEKVIVELIIDPVDGSLDVKQQVFVRSYAASRGKLIRQDDTWSADILEPRLIVNSPRKAAIFGPTFKDDPNGDKNVTWDFALENPLAMGESFDFIVEYKVAKGGTKSGNGAVDFFFYEQRKYPVRDLVFSVMLNDSTIFMLTSGAIVASVSDDRR